VLLHAQINPWLILSNGKRFGRSPKEAVVLCRVYEVVSKSIKLPDSDKFEFLSLNVKVKGNDFLTIRRGSGFSLNTGSYPSVVRVPDINKLKPGDVCSITILFPSGSEEILLDCGEDFVLRPVLFDGSAARNH